VQPLHPGSGHVVGERTGRRRDGDRDAGGGLCTREVGDVAAEAAVDRLGDVQDPAHESCASAARAAASVIPTSTESSRKMSALRNVKSTIP
jgi:hypothetical protein